LADCVFVAHNARFDYGFIKNEFRRIGQDFDAPVLCTVKLSRALYPQFHRHGLDALIERHGLTCTARHRAMGDTEALHQFAGIVAGQFERDVLDAAIVKAMKAPSRPAGLPEGVLEGLPEGPGVYFFYGENDLPIYIGKSVSLRSRVMSHFSADHRSGKEAKLAQQVRRVEWQQTAGELGALLLEARLVKERKPTENRLLRETDAVFGLRFDPTRKRGPVLVRELLGGGDPADWAGVRQLPHQKRGRQRPARARHPLQAVPAPHRHRAVGRRRLPGPPDEALRRRLRRQATPSTTSAC
jgi:DNA polymerase-3 subunit epsilon